MAQGVSGEAPMRVSLHIEAVPLLCAQAPFDQLAAGREGAETPFFSFSKALQLWEVKPYKSRFQYT